MKYLKLDLGGCQKVEQTMAWCDTPLRQTAENLKGPIPLFFVNVSVFCHILAMCIDHSRGLGLSELYNVAASPKCLKYRNERELQTKLTHNTHSHVGPGNQCDQCGPADGRSQGTKEKHPPCMERRR